MALNYHRAVYSKVNGIIAYRDYCVLAAYNNGVMPKREFWMMIMSASAHIEANLSAHIIWIRQMAA